MMIEEKPELIKIDLNSTWRSVDNITKKSELLYPALSDDGILYATKEQGIQIMKHIVDYLVSNQNQKG